MVRQENSYYGFGMQLPNSPVSPTPANANKDLYNGGSEWQNDFAGMPDYYQTFYRNYDAAIGRFVGVDPIPESAEDMSVYQYAGNNPIMGNDPMGGQTLTRYYEDATHLHVYDNDNGAPSTANGGRAGGMDPGYEGFDVYAAGGDASAGENSTIGYGNGAEGAQTLLWFAQRGDRMAQSIFSMKYWGAQFSNTRSKYT